uniref:Uncharacterized protein n=1 Tax=Anguilla anguilla TaxID=7936 RepID=A0A0E9U5J8_ANGAN
MDFSPPQMIKQCIVGPDAHGVINTSHCLRRGEVYSLTRETCLSSAGGVNDFN